MTAPVYSRVLLKLSGEAFAGDEGYGIDGGTLRMLAGEIVGVRQDLGTDVAVVVGGGNIWRGQIGAGEGMDRAQADQMGMLATVINALGLQDVLEQMGQPTRVQSAVHMEQIAEPYIRRRAIRHLEKGRVVILAAGTGNPFYTTDSCAALRATELECEVLLKATKVDGVYTADPKKDPTATRYDRLTFNEALQKRLGIMDMTALAMCQEQGIPVLVFDFKKNGNIRRVIQGADIGTLVTND